MRIYRANGNRKLLNAPPDDSQHVERQNGTTPFCQAHIPLKKVHIMRWLRTSFHVSYAYPLQAENTVNVCVEHMRITQPSPLSPAELRCVN